MKIEEDSVKETYIDPVSLRGGPAAREVCYQKSCKCSLPKNRCSLPEMKG